MDLLVHMELLKDRESLIGGIEVFNAVSKFGVESLDIRMNVFKQLMIVNDDAAIVRVELFTNHPNRKRWFAIKQCRSARLGGLGFNGVPLVKQTRHISMKFVFGC